MKKYQKIIFNEVGDKNKWEELLAKYPEANFLQSWNWGAFQQEMNKKVWRLEVIGIHEVSGVEKNESIGVIGLIKETAKRGNYLSIAGGPIIGWDKLSLDELKLIFQNLRELAKKEHCLFIRFRPQAIVSENSKNLENTIKKLGAVPSPMHLTADLTLQLDLTKDLETILKEMRKNTRYEIRQVEKKNVTTKVSTNVEEIKNFYDHQIILAKRHNFVPFSFDFLRKQFLNFLSDNQVALIHSFSGGNLLASAFIIFYNKEAIYHYGISTEENHRLPGSYACQWAAIAEAKNRGCTKYNFWGIAPKEQKNHRFAGVSTFKRGFGGEEIQYLPAHDIPVSPWYRIVWAFEILRKKSRGL